MDVITTHSNADFDGLASMVASRKLFPEATLVLPAGAQEAVRNFLAVHDLKDVDLSQVTRLVLVDTQEPDRIGALKSCIENSAVEVVVFDHHPEPDSACAGRSKQSVIESVGATTTLLIEQLRRRHIPVTPFEATVMALGLYEETGSFGFSSTTSRDLEAGAFLVAAGGDLNMVADVLHRPLDPDAVALLNDFLEHSDVHYLEGRKVLVATSTIDRCRGEAAGVVQRLAELQAVDAVIVVVMMTDRVEVIGRSRRPEIDVGWIAREFGGGGHAVAAAATVKGQTLAEVKERVVRLLTTQYRPTLLAQDVMTCPVKAIEVETSVTEAGQRMTAYGLNVFPVLDENDHYAGLISRESIQKALFHRLGKMAVRDIMQTDAYIAQPDTPFHEIETAMIERNQRFVPIVRDATIVGVITRTDLLRTLHDDVLKVARMRTMRPNEADAEIGGPRRNVKGLLRSRLPHHLVTLLEDVGHVADRCEVRIFVVGGCVRDLLLGIKNLDLDLVVEGDGIAFARTLGDRLHAKVKIHERFGTAILLLPDGFKLDVATARTEYYEYPTALPTVEQGSIKKDLYRRDFTINALAVRLNGKGFGDVLDFYGGQRDLNDKVIRVLHGLSFVEDPTRVFRAIRFETRFGFHLGKDTAALIAGAVKMNLFQRLSGHRLLEELKLLLGEREPKQAIKRLAELNLLKFIHPKLSWSDRLDRLMSALEEAVDWYRLLYLDRKMDVWLVYMMGLLELLPERAVKDMLKRFPFSEQEATRLKMARVGCHNMIRRLASKRSLTPAEVYHLLSGLSDETLLILMAKSKGETVKRQVSAFLTTYQHVKPIVTGMDLKAMGLKPGPQFKKILDQLLAARLNGEVKTEAEERRFLHQLVQAQGRCVKDRKQDITDEMPRIG
ncbi:MAG: CBS domain-containing protein [Nitrospira sp.]|nr:CBS domain-containing protein [Nitrospira sp.]